MMGAAHRGLALALALFLCGAATAGVTPSRAAERPVDLLLVLAVDASGSVDTRRFELQRRGYAEAFASREVMDAIAAGENHAIAVTLVEWSGAGHQRQMVGWTLVEDTASAESFGSALAEVSRAFSDWTSISSAIDYSAALFADAQVDSMRRVIDISGDGINNNGRSVTEARDAAVDAGITLNGLPILTEYPNLDAYYRDNVIGGPGAFALAASDFNSFGAAILGKLVREIAGTKAPTTVSLAASH